MSAQTVDSYAPRTVKSRRIKFAFGDEASKGRHFVDGDPGMSHLVAVLSAGFPGGEEMFIRSVHHFQEQITDPVLTEQVKGFIGQEMTHGREHRNLNDTLATMGYPVNLIDKLIALTVPLEKLFPPLMPLAATAAAEHLTAVLAARVLTEKAYIDRVAYDTETRNLLNWHVFEELEHKAVAFDVYRAMGGSEALRIGVMLAAIPGGIGISALGLLFSTALDPEALRRPVRTLRSILALPFNPILKGLLPELLEYARPGFHPDQTDTDGLLEETRERLFGAHGELVDHLK